MPFVDCHIFSFIESKLFMEKCDECGLGFWENGSRDVSLEKGDISEW